MKLKFFYIHGFASRYDERSKKVEALGELGTVSKITIDYTMSPDQIGKHLKTAISESSYDCLVGSSLGGFWASQLSSKLNIPFVAINPAIDPAKTLNKYVGEGMTHFRKPYYLPTSVVDSYPDFNTVGEGLILLDQGDEVISSENTREHLKEIYRVIVFDGGDHRFQHMQASLDLIKEFIADSYHK